MPEPLNILVLDFNKSEESKLCLESIKRCINFPHKVVFLDNGSKEKYARKFKEDGLIDVLIENEKNQGLGIGTKQLIERCDSEFFIYLQNDQILSHNITEEVFNKLTDFYNQQYGDFIIKSISLAGQNCGNNIYSERAHIGNTDFYKSYLDKLPNGGCGPYHHLPWIEGAWQEIYKQNKFAHFTKFNCIIDNGQTAERENPDGSRWRHYTDTKQLWLISGPIKEKFVYPYFSDLEWQNVLDTQSWPDGQIPEREKANSFNHWHSK